MGTKALRCRNGEDAVNLLIRSGRLQDDLKHYIEMPDQVYQICVREFTNFEVLFRLFFSVSLTVQVDLEFRGFVWNNKMTAVTQYNEFCFFPGTLCSFFLLPQLQEMTQYKDSIDAAIRPFTEQNLIGKVKLDSFVIDFIVIAKDNNLTGSEKYNVENLDVKVQIFLFLLSLKKIDR